jgi:hypothetical protein
MLIWACLIWHNKNKETQLINKYINICTNYINEKIEDLSITKKDFQDFELNLRPEHFHKTPKFKDRLKKALENKEDLYKGENPETIIYEFVYDEMITIGQADILLKTLNEKTIAWDETTYQFINQKQKEKEKR